MRETVWPLSSVVVGNLREVAPSKILLLRGVIHDENSANNGGISIIFEFVDNHSCFSSTGLIQFT